MGMEPRAEGAREFTLAELAKYDGNNGSRAYIVFEGTVYDVSDSPLWRNGLHVRKHQAGADLTEQLASAPHWGEVFTCERVRQAPACCEWDPELAGVAAYGRPYGREEAGDEAYTRAKEAA